MPLLLDQPKDCIRLTDKSLGCVAKFKYLAAIYKNYILYESKSSVNYEKYGVICTTDYCLAFLRPIYEDFVR
jgi:hypothetical protein